MPLVTRQVAVGPRFAAGYSASADPRFVDAVIFDLDGVVTDRASIHATAWTTMLDDFLGDRPPHEGENHTPFSDDDYRRLVDGKPRLDGVSDFRKSRSISLDHGSPADSRDRHSLRLGQA